jgi:uncharacterized protein YhaN
MRFLSISFSKFGPFEDFTLDVSQGRYGLHLIHGPNEAGKSTALRGLEYVLFGFPQRRDLEDGRDRDDFRYPASEQRLGACLVDRQGKQLAYLRRRGRKQAISSADQRTTVAEEDLQAMLGGLDREQFRMLFGLGHAHLVQGGQEIVEGKGDLGEALFAAGTGLAGLRRLQELLGSRQSELYTPRGKSQIISETLGKLRAARDKEKASTLQMETWQAQASAHKAAVDRLAELDGARRQAQREVKHLQDLSAVIPSIRQLQEVESELRSLPPRASILDQEAALDSLRESLGEIKKAAKDRINLARHHENLKQRATALLQKHLQRDRLEDATALSPSAVVRQRIRSLAEEHLSIQVTLEKGEADLREVEALLAADEQRLAEQPPLPDLAGLEALRSSILQQGPLEKQEAELILKREKHRERAARLLQRLSPCWSGSAHEAGSLRVPTTEQTAAYEKRFAELAEARRREEARLQEQRETEREAAAAIEKLERQGALPSEESLTQARLERDAGLRLLRAQQVGSAGGGQAEVQRFIQDHAPGGDLWTAVERLVRRCDALADQLRREAQRVAERLGQEHRLLAARKKAEHSEAELARISRSTTDLDDEWRATWRQAGVQPRTPAEMLGWLKAHSDLTEVLADEQAAAREVEQVSQQIRLARQRLEVALGLEAADHPRSIGELLELAQRRLASVQGQVKKRDELQSRVEAGRQQQGRLQRQLAQSRARLQTWQSEWQEAIGSLDFEQKEKPRVVEELLRHLDEINQVVKEASDFQGRMEGIDKDRLGFFQRLDQLRMRLDGSVTEPASEANMQDVVDALDQRLREAQKLESRREARTAEARRLRSELHRRAGPQELAAFMETALAAEGTLDARLQELQEQLEGMEQEIKTHAAAAGAAQAQLDQWQKAGSDAADGRQERVSLLANLRDQVAEYAVVSVARSMLQRAIERFRERHQDSMLSRAGHYFAVLSNQAFCGLEVEDTDEDRQVLVAARSSPREQVRVSGLSDGTRDQLFLALRLAGIEEHLRSPECEPMPLIVDDVLVNFDNARSAATLRCLAELSQQTQVLLFTHHEHLFDLAKATLPPGAFFSYRLNCGD